MVLTRRMRQALDVCKRNDGRLQKYHGGLWTKVGLKEEYPAPRVTIITKTVNALIRRNLMVRESDDKVKLTKLGQSL